MLLAISAVEAAINLSFVSYNSHLNNKELQKMVQRQINSDIDHMRQTTSLLQCIWTTLTVDLLSICLYTQLLHKLIVKLKFRI